MRTHLAFLTGALLLVGCPTPTTPPVCAAGAAAACVGVGGCAGGQVCNATGTAWGPCDCGGTDAGSADAGTPIDTGTADVGGTSDTGVEDAGVTDDVGVADDAGMLDDAGPPGPCDPVTQMGCGPSERCTWVRSGTFTGDTLCVPNGSPLCANVG